MPSPGRRRRRRPEHVEARLLFALALSASPLAGSTTAADPTKIRFVTDWKAQAPQGGFYQAKALGLYAAQGLDVEIIQGGPSVNVPLLLGSNEADFGIGSNSFIPLNIVQAGIPATAVAAIFQKGSAGPDHAPARGHPIDRRHEGQADHDLGRRGRQPLDLAEGQVRVHGSTDPQVHLQPRPLSRRPARHPAGLCHQRALRDRKGERDCTAGLSARRRGLPLLRDADPGLRRRIQADPQQVRAFVAASIAGWKDYLTGDPHPATA
jgi:NitT/TauT family transport system substrate-binding protein